MTFQGTLPTSIKVLLVEGNDDKRFFEALMQHSGVNGISVEIYGGKSNLGNRLVNLSGRLNAYTDASIGIVRYADFDSRGAFDSVVGSLRRANLPTPGTPLMPIEQGDLRVSVLILPPDEGEGELEDLCLRSIEGLPDMECVDNYFDCLNGTGIPIAANRAAKARLHSFLAAGPVHQKPGGETDRRQPGLRLGEAADAGVWDWSSPAFEKVADFLRSL